MSKRKPNARLAALKAVGDVLDNGRQLGESRAIPGGLPPRDAAFARRLAYGLLRWEVALAWLADGLLERPLKPRDRDVGRLVQLGLLQLWREDIDAHAAVHATAEVAKSLRKPWAVGLVNAVLRRFQREQDDRLAALERDGPAHAHPAWLLEAIQADWPDHWRDIVSANNEEPPLWLRNNAQRQLPGDLARTFREAGFEASTHPEAGQALSLVPPAPVERIPGFTEGRCSVQDAAAQLAASLLNAAPDDRVLDACAAPGGKTCHLLERTPGLSVTALELQESRMERVRENLERLDLSAQLVVGDAARPDDWWDGQPFDRILLDAPCTATGVIRRHPEIRCLRGAGQVREAAALQARLLDALWPLLRPGGMLVYATCSVLKVENSEQIQSFLGRTADANCTGPDDPSGRQDGPGRQILPGAHGMDGFYYAVLHRTA